MRADSTPKELSVLYVDMLHATSGGQFHVEGFMRAAERMGVRVQRLSLAPERLPGGGRSAARRLPPVLTRWARDVLLLLRDRQARSRLMAVAKEASPDVLLLRDAPMFGAGRRVAEQLGIPYVLEVNAPLAYELRQHYRGGLCRLVARRERANWEAAAAIVCVSEVLRQYILAHSNVNPVVVTVVPNGADPSRFDGLEQARIAELRRDLGFAAFPETTVLCFSGTLQPWHGAVEFVEAFADLPERCSGLVVGSGRQAEELSARLRELRLGHRVAAVGRVEHAELPYYLAACDAAVMPYPRLDVFYFSPLKMFEFLAAGLPIIASNQGQIGEILQSGANGVLYEPEPAGSHANLAAAISSLLAAPNLQTMREANRRLAASYTWQENAASVVKVIASSLTRDAKRPGIAR